MGIVLELYELKNLCKDMAELGAANYAKWYFRQKILFPKGRLINHSVRLV